MSKEIQERDANEILEYVMQHKKVLSAEIDRILTDKGIMTIKMRIRRRWEWYEAYEADKKERGEQQSKP